MRRQLQASDPAFRLGLNGRHLVRRKTQSLHFIEKGIRFLLRKSQVCRPDFQHLTLSAQPCHQPGGVLSGDDNEVHLRRLAFQQKTHYFMDFDILNGMKIVEDED